eukprot:SAG11_NODE_3061_length_2717_cov_2.912944_1_plen_100_part_10
MLIYPGSPCDYLAYIRSRCPPPRQNYYTYTSGTDAPPQPDGHGASRGAPSICNFYAAPFRAAAAGTGGGGADGGEVAEAEQQRPSAWAAAEGGGGGGQQL